MECNYGMVLIKNTNGDEFCSDFDENFENAGYQNGFDEHTDSDGCHCVTDDNVDDADACCIVLSAM